MLSNYRLTEMSLTSSINFTTVLEKFLSQFSRMLTIVITSIGKI